MGASVGNSGGLNNEPNVVPMIDIMLVLLVIFILVQQVRKAIDIQLPDPTPQVATANSASNQIVLEVLPGGQYAINREPVDSANLGTRLKEIYDPRPDKIIFVKGDPKVEFQEVIHAMDVARGAGVRVTATTEVAQVGTDVLGRLGPFAAPCRVVYVTDELNRRGFAYGSLPGHAVCGEEMFGVRYDPADNGVYSEVVAFSRPATWWSRLGTPVLSLAQRIVTMRYLNAV
jgi:uncharacterized protein (UPF0548 family)